jgi:hypothetical protein
MRPPEYAGGINKKYGLLMSLKAGGITFASRRHARRYRRLKTAPDRRAEGSVTDAPEVLFGVTNAGEQWRYLVGTRVK